jgi:hypothetical protein
MVSQRGVDVRIREGDLGNSRYHVSECEPQPQTREYVVYIYVYIFGSLYSQPGACISVGTGGNCCSIDL